MAEQTEGDSTTESRVDLSKFDVPKDLSGFQRDLLCVLRTLDTPIGLEVDDAMEALYRKEINHGRLYPNLDDLAEKGLIDKRQKDKRTNEYVITRRGEYVLDEYRRFVDGTVTEDVDVEADQEEIDYSDYDVPKDLTEFQRDLICVLSSMDRPAGKEVDQAMEDLYREEINHGRLYPNLDELAEKGLIDKRQKDKRTNEYTITRRGSYVLAELRRLVDGTIPLN